MVEELQKINLGLQAMSDDFGAEDEESDDSEDESDDEELDSDEEDEALEE